MDTNRILQFIDRIESAGFGLELEGDGLAIISDSDLSEMQLQYLKDHKAGIVQVLRARELGGDCQSGNDIDLINDPGTDQAVITVVKHVDGEPYQFDMELPTVHLEKAKLMLARCELCIHAVNRLPYESFLVRCDRPEIIHDGAAGNPKGVLRICHGFEANNQSIRA